MEDAKPDRKKEKQKTDETRNNLGKAWVAYKGVCAGSLQEFVNHLLAVHELYCHNSRDRQRAALAEEGEVEEGEATQAPTPKNSHSRTSRDDRSSPESQLEEAHRRHSHHAIDQHTSHSITPTHSECLQPRSSQQSPSKRPRPAPSSRSVAAAPIPRSRSRSLSRTRQVSRVRMGGGRGVTPRESSDDDGDDDDEDDDLGDRSYDQSGMGGGPGKNARGVCVRGLPVRSSDTALRDGLYHKFKKHGKISSVSVFGENEERYAVVSFKKGDDVQRAVELEEADNCMFFGSKIELSLHEGFGAPPEDDYPEPDCNEYHQKATRTLYVRNLEGDIRIPDLRELFKTFGEILDIDIKHQGGQTKYAFIQYSDILSVVNARREMEDRLIGSHKIKTGFGKSLPTKCVWLDNVSEQITENYLCAQFSRHGVVINGYIDRAKAKALVFFDAIDAAQYAVNEMRGRVLYGKKIMIDFASQVCEQAFFDEMERMGAMCPSSRPGPRGQRSNTNFFPGNRDGAGGSSGSGNAAYGGHTGPKVRAQRGSMEDRQYGYNNQPAPQRGRSTMLPSDNANNQSSYSGRMVRGAGGARDGANSGYDARNYSNYGPERSSMHRENSFEQVPGFMYRKQDQRSLSPPRKRRSLQVEPRNNRSQGGTRDLGEGGGGRYIKQYQERYPSPPNRERTELYDPHYGNVGHFVDSDNNATRGNPQSGRSIRSFHNEPQRGDYRHVPAYDSKEIKAEFSPARSSSDFNQRTPSPDGGNYDRHSSSPVTS